MQKLLLFVLLLVGIYFVRRAIGRNRTPRSDGRADAARNGSEDILACAHCGLLVPRSEGTELAEAFYCSAEHARLGRR